MVNKEVRLVIPKVLYDKLKKTYEEEGYGSVNTFVNDLIRERVMVKKKGKRGRKKKKNFLDYFSKRRIK